MTDKLAPGSSPSGRTSTAIPSSAYQEVRTSALVADYFRKLGLEVRTGYAKTGVIGILKGGKPGPVVAMRGDMDALPITEETDLPFASKEKAVVEGRETGVMHACGHDIHTTVLLGVAAVLASVKADLPGTVVFVAQPAEEIEGGGASLMIKEGAFRDIIPAAFFAYHVDDTLKAGKIGYTSGFMTANVDDFDLRIDSEGCHGANPDPCVDPIVVGAEIVTALQVLISREISVRNDTVITVGSFHAGSARNIIPQSAKLEATVRSYGEDQRQALQERSPAWSRTSARRRAPSSTWISSRHAVGLQRPGPDRRALATAERVLGSKATLVEQKPEMGGEDFSYFGKIAPAVMFNLGVVPPELEATAVHSPTFIADEAAIPIGVNLMANIIFDHQAKAAKAAGKKVPWNSPRPGFAIMPG